MKEKLNGLNVSLISSISPKLIISIVTLAIFLLLLLNNTFTSSSSKELSSANINTKETNKENFEIESEFLIEDFSLDNSNSTEEIQTIIDKLIINTQEKAHKLGFNVNVSSNEKAKLKKLLEKDKEYLLEQWVKSYQYFAVNLIALDSATLVTEVLSTK